MNKTTVDVVRGTRCVLVVVHKKGKTRQYEYHQSANLDVACNVSLVRFKGDWDC
jgi:hypothetical protein